MFSFNSPYGACPHCDGLGTRLEIDERLIIPRPERSIREGAIVPVGEERGSWYYEMIGALANELGFKLDQPWQKLKAEHRNIILYGTGEKKVNFRLERDTDRVVEFASKFEGVINNLYRRYRQTNSGGIRDWIESFMNQIPCPECEGTRLRKESLGVLLQSKNISQVTAMNIGHAYEFFDALELNERDTKIAQQILKEIKARLNFLLNVGLNYLTLDRTAGTLFGWRSAADSPGNPNWKPVGRRPVCS